MLDSLKNLFLSPDKYKVNSEAVIISCFFNPQHSSYRLDAFLKFYESIKHLNYRITECVIGEDSPQLDMLHDKNISTVYAKDLLWHKEALLNNIVKKLPANFKYVFWVDADVLFTNKNWLVDSVAKFKEGCNILQPFQYCTHLEEGEVEPIDMKKFEKDKKSVSMGVPPSLPRTVWLSFSAVLSDYFGPQNGKNSDVYDLHGHVGFAWGAKREILDAVPLYDKALVGGADHIIAHAAVGQFPSKCIDKSFTADLTAIYAWSKLFFKQTRAKIDFVDGELYHIWHGEIEKRQYLKRVKEFTPTSKTIIEKDSNGLYQTNNPTVLDYVSSYFISREILGDDNTIQTPDNSFQGFDGGTSGGGGATGNWDVDPNSQPTNIGGDPIDNIGGQPINSSNDSTTTQDDNQNFS